VIISVTDTGFGVELENVHSISQLQRRKKVWAGPKRMCERIVKNHGGKIDVESQLDKGTTFKTYLR
jgi:sensor histidine kinase regulating citrate/malate metabolism